MSAGAPGASGGGPGAFLDRLRRGPVLLLDGGLGSLLIARGLPPGVPPDLWTLERPGELAAVHRAYVEAGSEAVHANTFGANPARLARFGLEARLAEINETAVRLARVSSARWVIADIGPTGEYLPPVGTGDPEEWRRGFLEQARVLAGTGIDAFHVETMTDLREARIAVAALREVAPGLPILASLAFEEKKRGFFTPFGDPPAALAELIAAGADAAGANCGIASAQIRRLAEAALPALGSARLVFQPNAGQPVREGSSFRYTQLPEAFAEDLAPLAAHGAAALGGCCGTDPAFIAALRAALSTAAGSAS